RGPTGGEVHHLDRATRRQARHPRDGVGDVSVDRAHRGAGRRRRPLMRLLSWNILAGGGSRCGAILKVLRQYDAEVIALQETMPARATDLCHALARAGYTYRFSTPRLHNRGQCVLSRVPL